MKIQLDYNNKLLTICCRIPYKEFHDNIQKILPDWEDWNIGEAVYFNYHPYPIIIPKDIKPTPWWEFRKEIITYYQGKITGTYQIQMN